jgi:hypothetical protein
MAVVPGLDPGTHVAPTPPAPETGPTMDGRVKHGHDELGERGLSGRKYAGPSAEAPPGSYTTPGDTIEVLIGR